MFISFYMTYISKITALERVTVTNCTGDLLKVEEEFTVCIFAFVHWGSPKKKTTPLEALIMHGDVGSPFITACQKFMEVNCTLCTKILGLAFTCEQLKF